VNRSRVSRNGNHYVFHSFSFSKRNATQFYSGGVKGNCKN